MEKRTELVDYAYDRIENCRRGNLFDNQELYRFLEENYPRQIEERGDADREPRYKNDARWAVQNALRNGLIERLARGKYRRI